jgi:hypothetical protein
MRKLLAQFLKRLSIRLDPTLRYSRRKKPSALSILEKPIEISPTVSDIMDRPENNIPL